jgi:hypothetical protein
MSKIVIPSLTASYVSVPKLNEYFQSLEDELNDKVLYRDSPEGEPNIMQNDLDMNSNDVLNVNNIQTTTITLGGQQFDFSSVQAVLPPQTGEAGKFLQTDGNASTWEIPAATEISNVPAGSISSTDVQAAINELDTEKQNINYTPSGTGAAVRTVESKLGEFVSVKDFGAVGDGITDDTVAIQNALDSGANVIVLTGGTAGFVVDSALNVPDYVSLKGDYSYIDPRNGQEISNYSNRLILDSTITLNESSAVANCMIVKKGITVPANAAAVATWTGTAITTAASTHGQYVGYCSINGFDRAIFTETTTNTEQFRVEHVNFDCQNGIRIENCFDIAYIENCHGWPSLSIAVAGLVDADLRRSGVAYEFVNGGDWNKITNCFSYGYARCLVIDSCNSVTAIGVGADYTATLDATLPIGIEVKGTSGECRLIGCQTAGQNIGCSIDSSSANNHVSIIGHNSWACDAHHIINNNGQVSISNSRIRGGVYGITPNDNGPTMISDVSFDGLTGVAINNQTTSNVVRWDSLCTFTNVTKIANTIYTPTVASADPLTINGEDLLFEVTGTTNFGSLLRPDSYTGKTVTLKFTGALTVLDGGNMNLAGNFVTTADDTLTLVSTGTGWVEVARSAN